MAYLPLGPLSFLFPAWVAMGTQRFSAFPPATLPQPRSSHTLCARHLDLSCVHGLSPQNHNSHTPRGSKLGPTASVVYLAPIPTLTSQYQTSAAHRNVCTHTCRAPGLNLRAGIRGQMRRAGLFPPLTWNGIFPRKKKHIRPWEGIPWFQWLIDSELVTCFSGCST
jgi:hypothetical protein